MRVTGRVVLSILVLAAPVATRTQTPAATLVSVERNTSGATAGVDVRVGGRLVVTNTSFRDLIRFVHGLPETAVEGGPVWLSTDRYDLVVEAEGQPSREQWMAIMRTLLAERLKLVTRMETRETQAYELALLDTDGQFGPNLAPTTTSCTVGTQDAPSASCRFDLAPGSITAVGRPMERLVRAIGQVCGAPVEDGTNLTGLYDLRVTWTPNSSTTPCAALSIAIERQLGLTLRRMDGAQVLVIESAVRP